MDQVKALIPDTQVPSGLEGSKLARLAQVMTALAEVNRRNGRTESHVSSRKIAKLAVGMNYRTVLRRVAHLEDWDT